MYPTPGTSEIGVFDPVNNTYTTIFNDYAQVPAGELPMNFRKEYPIQGEFKIDSTGNVSIYWTDDNEQMRYMRIYTPPTTGLAFDVETLNIFPLLSKAPMPVLKAITSGILDSGMYALTVALVNDEGTPTNYVNLSNWVKVTDDSESSATAEVANAGNSGSGFVNNTMQKLNVMSYTGCVAGFSTGKGITWTVNNLDPRYDFIRPVIIINIAGAITCITLQDIDYDTTISSSQEVSYTGNETAEAEILSNILIARESYAKAKTVAQVDDVLYWGNLVKSRIDIDYQPYANNIEIEAVFANPDFDDTHTINGVTVDFDPATGGTQRTAHEQYFHKGYQRDETYAFYITWIMADGNETVAYHIPGREPIPINNYAGMDASTGTFAYETAMASNISNAIPALDIGTGTIPQYQRFNSGDIELYKVKC